jgi:hypothetical protein
MTPLPPTVSPQSPCRVFVNRDARASQTALSIHALNRGRAIAYKRCCQQGPHTSFGKACASQIWRATVLGDCRQ